MKTIITLPIAAHFNDKFHFLPYSMTPRKNVGGAKGKGPAKRTPIKRPPPLALSSSDEEDQTADQINALIARVNALEKEKGGGSVASVQRPTRTASRALLLKSLSSRISVLESGRQKATPTLEGRSATQETVEAEPQRSSEAAVDHQPQTMAQASTTSSSDVTRVLHRRRVLVCGHSFIHWAERQARRGTFGQHLGLSTMAMVDWKGRRGLRWDGLIPLLFNSGSCYPPDVLIIHLGGNDLGLLKGRALFLQALSDIQRIKEAWPQVCIAWSAIIPRPNWPNGDGKKLDGARKRVNKAIKKEMEKGLGYYIHHDEIHHKNQELYRIDGIHLSEKGNMLFLGDIQRAIKLILGDLVGDRS
ncbi:uncharacterized protein [Anolis sagrei]|uniref:uncharacterized protein n=1 Tax=Anolis sagrei TaxID=38937 RepID=UPI003521505C